MSDKPFKQFERTSAALIHGSRYPANQGGKVDVKGETFLGTCKLVQSLSLAELTRLVVEIEAEAEKVGKRGVLFVKLRSGKGNATPLLVVMSEKNWAHKCVACGGPAVSGAICASCVENA